MKISKKGIFVILEHPDTKTLGVPTSNMRRRLLTCTGQQVNKSKYAKFDFANLHRATCHHLKQTANMRRKPRVKNSASRLIQPPCHVSKIQRAEIFSRLATCPDENVPTKKGLASRRWSPWRRDARVLLKPINSARIFSFHCTTSFEISYIKFRVLFLVSFIQFYLRL